MKRSFPALVILLVAAGCTSPAEPRSASTPGPARPGAIPSSAPSVCTPGEVRFGKATTTEVLTDVSPVMSITARSGGPLDEPLEPVGTVTAAVTAGPEVPAADVYRELGEQRYEQFRLVELGTEHRPDDDRGLSVHGAGDFVVFEYVQRIEVPFTYACGSAEFPGSVTTWTAGHDTGTIDCADPDVGDSAVARTAFDLRCRHLS